MLEKLKNGDKEYWHLDKKVPIAIITAIVVQTFSFVYFATSWKVVTESRLAVIEQAIKRDESQEARIIVLEQVAIRISDDLSEIKSILRSDRFSPAVNGGKPQ